MSSPNSDYWDPFIFELVAANAVIYAVLGAFVWLGLNKSRWFLLIAGIPILAMAVIVVTVK
jgi:hypothetical protein